MIAGVFVRISGIGLALAVAVLLGCGGNGSTEGAPTESTPTESTPTGEEGAVAWNNREGKAWAAYEKGWTAGAVKGCEATFEKAYAENPRQFDESKEAMVDVTCPFVASPADLEHLYRVYPNPPANPGVHGYEDGAFEGCVLAYSKLGELEPVRLCQPEAS